MLCGSEHNLVNVFLSVFFPVRYVARRVDGFISISTPHTPVPPTSASTPTPHPHPELCPRAPKTLIGSDIPCGRGQSPHSPHNRGHRDRRLHNHPACLPCPAQAALSLGQSDP